MINKQKIGQKLNLGSLQRSFIELAKRIMNRINVLVRSRTGRNVE